MSRRISVLVLALALGLPAIAQDKYPRVGRTATAAEIAAWDIDVRPDFKGLPAGSGSAKRGQAIWEAKCESCHGTFGESNEFFTPLIGGTTPDDIQSGRVKSLVTGDTARTTFMKLSQISTLWDYVNRAMPWNAPKSLSTEEVYAVVAYMLHLADLVPADFVLSNANMAEVQARLPNRLGKTREHGLGSVRGAADVRNVACMKDCATQSGLGSALPDYARFAHGNLAEQNRAIGPVRGGDSHALTQVGAVPVPAKATSAPDLARSKACLSCHGIDRKIVGPAFTDIAAKYAGQATGEAMLVDKLKKGGAGVWGTLPMPPQPDLADAEALALVRWILGGAK